MYKAGQKTLTSFLKSLEWLYEFFNKDTDEILKIIEELFEKAKELLSVFNKATLETFEVFSIEIKEVPKSPVLGSGGGAIITLLEESKYALIKEGKEIFRGTKKEVEEFAEKLKTMSDEAAEKYLDEIVERRKIFLKWADKFEKKFHHHFDGEFTIGKLSNRDATQVLKGTGGHNHSVIGQNVQIRQYLTQPTNDLPFDALIEVRYKQGQWIEKQAKSSMFPKNWDIKRVKEEVAMVYDKMIDSGIFEQIKNHKTPSFKSFDSKGNFEIKIEFDELGNITNAYPNI